MKKYILFAGVNGAGKSTLYQSQIFPPTVQRINTDEIIREFGKWYNPPDIITAGKIVIKRFDEYI